MAQIVTKDCGCQIIIQLDSRLSIVYCPLHGSALEMREALDYIAGQTMTDEGDFEATEDFFGIGVNEVIAMAHDNMILKAREALAAAAENQQR